MRFMSCLKHDAGPLPRRHKTKKDLIYRVTEHAPKLAEATNLDSTSKNLIRNASTMEFTK
jgi:hypothetical protein